jgi:hypothetical protein
VSSVGKKIAHPLGLCLPAAISLSLPRETGGIFIAFRCIQDATLTEKRAVE